MMKTNLLWLIGLVGIFNCTIISAQSSPDCVFPFPICEKISYHFNDLNGHGELNDPLPNLRCTPEDFKEMNSHWMKFEIEESGTLTFSIDPENDNHDVDFMLFKSNDFDCSTLEEIRCMASGQSLGEVVSDDSICLGSTGIRMNSIDEFEYFGCKLGDDNYLKYLDTEEGEQYLLFVNDYHVDGAISVTFEGSAELVSLNECNSDQKIDDLQISRVYPNPAKKSINVEFVSFPEKIIDIEIIDLQSIVVRRMQLTPREITEKLEIDLESIPSGMYLIRMKQDRRTAIKQFVKI